jgi:hypothetical protein
MGTRPVKPLRASFIVPVFFSVALVILGVSGCATTAPDKATTGPGTPDATQLQHYEMLKSAIEAKSKNDALAALALLQSDVSRWQTNVLITMNAYVDQAALTDAVDREDWAVANKRFQALAAKYPRR